MRPVPSTDPMGVMAALNWQSQGLSQGLSWANSLADPGSSTMPVRGLLSRNSSSSAFFNPVHVFSGACLVRRSACSGPSEPG